MNCFVGCGRVTRSLRYEGKWETGNIQAADLIMYRPAAWNLDSCPSPLVREGAAV